MGNTIPAKPDSSTCQSVQQMSVILCHQFHETQLVDKAEKTAGTCRGLNASNLLQQSF